MPDYTIPNLKNACRILTLISEQGTALSLAEISRQLSLPKSSVLRILFTLESERFVVKDKGHYSLGSALITLGSKASKNAHYYTLTRPVLEAITQATNETTQLATLSGNQVLILDVCDSPHPLATHSRPGNSVDVHCSSTGKAILAFLDSDKQQAMIDRLDLVKRTENTITSRSSLMAHLRMIREHGYSIDEQEYHAGIRCIAVPVFGKEGSVEMAIGLTASTGRFKKAKIKAYAELLRCKAAELSSQFV